MRYMIYEIRTYREYYMLLVIDIGNTNIVFGVFDNSKLVNHWRLSTAIHKTIDEYAILLNSLLYIEKIKLNEIDAAIISCVVHHCSFPLKSFAGNTWGSGPYLSNPALRQECPFSMRIPRRLEPTG